MISGMIVKILTQMDDDWGRYMIEDASGKKTLAVGIIPSASPGMNVALEGRDQLTKWGRQYTIKEVLSTEKDDYSGIRSFLTSFMGYIGVKKANSIIDAFGENTMSVFEKKDCEYLLCQVKGIGPKLVKKITASYRNNKKYLPLVLYLNGAGTKNQVTKIYEKYGDDSVKVLKKNPYRLQMDIIGFGFAKADALALAAGLKRDSPERITAGIKYELDSALNKDGDCYLKRDEIRKRAVVDLAPVPRLKDITREVAENALADWFISGKEKLIKNHSPSQETIDRLSETAHTRKIISEGFDRALEAGIESCDFVDYDGDIFTQVSDSTEQSAAKYLARMVKEGPVRDVTDAITDMAVKSVEKRKTEENRKNGEAWDFEITPEQKEAVKLAVSNRVAVLTGGPGCGKTTTIETVAEAFLLAGAPDKSNIIMLAPTGRAAQRMTESTGFPASTVHRAVIKAAKTGQKPHGSLVIVDESSMVDIFLLKKILNYAYDCDLVFVGDVNQIASVGAGKCLKDMIDSGVIPTFRLTQGHRNSGSIAKNAKLINEGRAIRYYQYDDHFVYIPANKENINDVLIHDYVKKVDQYGIKNVMLCAAMKDRGPVSVNRLNLQLQEIYTKGHMEGTFGNGKIFRVGDRVMQTKNDYNHTIKRPDGSLEDGVFNGERGTVTHIMYDRESDEYRLVVLFDDGSVGGYLSSSAETLSLCYATTLHKCQGSEAPCMMMAYTFGDFMLLKRSLFYTGETRAKEEFRFYGEEKDVCEFGTDENAMPSHKSGRMMSAFDLAVRKTEDKTRNTRLAERIKDLVTGDDRYLSLRNDGNKKKTA